MKKKKFFIFVNTHTYIHKFDPITIADVPELSRTVKKIVASDAWQSLSSPFYPNSPPYSFFRHWLVTTDAGSIITLEVRIYLVKTISRTECVNV